MIAKPWSPIRCSRVSIKMPGAGGSPSPPAPPARSRRRRCRAAPSRIHVEGRAQNAERLHVVDAPVDQLPDEEVVEHAGAEEDAEAREQRRPDPVEERVRDPGDPRLADEPHRLERGGGSQEGDRDPGPGLDGELLEDFPHGVVAVLEPLDAVDDGADSPQRSSRPSGPMDGARASKAARRGGEPLPGEGGRGDDRHPEHPLQTRRVDADAPVRGSRPHGVQGDDEGDAALHQLEGEGECSFEVRRVDDVDDDVALAEHPAGDSSALLVGQSE